MTQPARLDASTLLRRIAERHHLPPATRARDPSAVVESLLALHSTDPATVALSVHIRCAHATLQQTADALSEAVEQSRTLVRCIGMRRTLHVVSAQMTPVIRSIYRDRLASPTRRESARLLVEAGVCPSEDAAAELERLERRILGALEARPATTPELAEKIPELKASFHYKPDKPYGGRVVIGGRIVNAIGILGDIVRANAQGGWRNGQYSWARLDRWLPDLADPPPPETARTLLVRRYLEAFGPVSLEDIPWWTGLPKGQIRKALAALGPEVIEVDVDGWNESQLMLKRDLEVMCQPLGRHQDGVALLPGLDPTIMGYKRRRRFLDPAWARELFDRNGNAGPTVWWQGRVIGGWAQRKDGKIVWRHDTPEAEPALGVAATALETALGSERVMPRFPNPLHKKLLAG